MNTPPHTAPELGSTHTITRKLAAFVVVGVTLSGCSSTESNDSIYVVAREYSVREFTYNPTTNKGHLYASEKFDTPVTDSNAEMSIIDELNKGDQALEIYFSNIPPNVRNGSFDCEMIKRNEARTEFDYECDVTPLSAPSATV
ncbi:MAG TPA: hypothetical protein VF575_02430 [Candidatus Saccharimonadales bacterium]|jgi:hypothetical protein